MTHAQTAPGAVVDAEAARIARRHLPEALTFIVLPLNRRANSGQVWQVMKVRGRTLHCMVLPENHDYTQEPTDAVVWHWRWDTAGDRSRSRAAR